MNANDFLDEVLASKKYLGDFETEYNRFQYYQNKALQTLKEFHRICEMNNIRYQLAYGSLIGAIRDKGMIPWDHDVDVFVPYEDKGKLVAALKEYLSSDYYAYCPEIVPNCYHTLMRIAPVGFHSDAVHVDVFYIMALPNDSVEQKRLLDGIDRLYHTRAVKKSNIFLDAKRGKKSLIKSIIEKASYIYISQKSAEKEYDRRCSMYRLEETDFCAPATFDADKCVYLTKELWNTEIIDMPIGSFRVTQEYDKILRQYYGDYMLIPDLDLRLREFTIALKKFDYYGKCYD